MTSPIDSRPASSSQPPWPTVWVFLNGQWPEIPWPSSPPPATWVLAADGGARALGQLGWPAHLVVGDLDSLSSSELAQVPQAPGFELLTFPRAKDQTDFELLWPLALERLTPSGQVAIVAGLGGRWDMTLANLLLPWARPWRGKWRGAQVVFWGQEKIYCLQGPACLPLAGDSLFSLLPALGQAGPITLTGQVAYPLQEGYLKWGHTRGVSNETGPQGGSLTLARGSLLVTVAPKTPA